MTKDKDYKGLAIKGSYTDEDLDCAMNCLIEADQIRNNKELMILVEDYAKKRENQISSIQDIREASYKLNDKEMTSKEGDDKPKYEDIKVGS